jgi:AmmeMemoRadiSam system protein A
VLRKPGAAFVTLDIRGRLRGCVGSLSASAPLVQDVARNAFAAAFQDYRFSPLTGEELPQLGLHISLLTPPLPFEVNTRDELIRTLRPGVDGLLLEDPPFRSTFLPQVWESLPDPEDFLSELFLKAGLPPDHWSPSLRFRRYRVEEI